MLIPLLRGVILISVLGWYSAAVWRMIDGYFKDQFRAYLQEEYRRNPRMRPDAENVRSVDKGLATGCSRLPTELSRIVEPYDLDTDTVCPADNSLLHTTHGDSREPMKEVTGGTSENAAGSTDKNALPQSRTRPSLESRRAPIGSDRHNDDEWRASAINQEGDHRERNKEVEEERVATEGSSEVSDGVLLASSATVPRPGKPRHWVGREAAFGRFDVSETFGEILLEERIMENRRMNMIALGDIDSNGARMSRQRDNDFSEFEDEKKEEEEKEGEEKEGEEEERMSQKVRNEGIPVSELPFKPEVDIDGLNRITAEEFCPLTLEDDTSCGKITTWS